MNLADILKEIGSEGMFQIMVLLALAMPKMPLQWSMTMMSYAAYEPEWCCVPHGVVVERGCDGVYQVPSMNVTNVTYRAGPGRCGLNASCCERKVYLAEDNASTAVTEWDLVCDLNWAVSFLSAIQMGGVMIGALVSGSLSDVFGRRRVNYASLLAHTLFNVIAGFSNSLAMFAVLRFLIGASIGSYLVVHVPYILEFVSPRWRVIPASLPFGAIGASLLPLAAWLLPDWRWMHFICAIFCAPFLLGFFFLPESMRWLTVKGKVNQAVKVADQVAVMNKMAYDPERCLKQIEKIARRETELAKRGKKYSYLDVYRGWKMARLTLTLQFVWFTTSLVGYGIILGISDLAGNVYVNMFLVEVVEIPFIMATYVLSNRLGRRYTSLAYFCLASLSAVLAFIFHLVPSIPGRDTGITVLCICCRTFIGGAAAVFVVVSTEVYPTVIRTLGFGAANSAAKVGGVLAPFIIDMDSIPTVSYVVMSVTCLLCVGAVLSLSETKNLAMEDTLEKAGSKSSLLSTLSCSLDPGVPPRRPSSHHRSIIDLDTDLIHHRSYSEYDDSDDEDEDQPSKEDKKTEQSTLLRQRHPMYDPALASIWRQESYEIGSKERSFKSDSMELSDKIMGVRVSKDVANRAYVGDQKDVVNRGFVGDQKDVTNRGFVGDQKDVTNRGFVGDQKDVASRTYVGDQKDVANRGFVGDQDLSLDSVDCEVGTVAGGGGSMGDEGRPVMDRRMDGGRGGDVDARGDVGS